MNHLWNSDLKNGNYQNPILCADYSDPDVIRVGDDFYMIASSFTYVPGVPVLHSRDLVNWELINYCVRKLPFDHYVNPVHGSGTWAPSLRYHEGVYYAFIPLPDEGIFVTETKDPYGEWSELRCICKAKGYIDPCPLWDDDGRAYMVFAYARSRCGIKHRLSVCEIDSKATKVIGEPKLIFDGVMNNPTIEGPKFYKKNGWYYIFAPAGGVATGWQTVLRSESVYGPYEYKIVMHQGDTEVNGPHQGGYVELQDGSSWFVHFQDIGIYGRICHLQPMCWNGGWPFIGMEQNGDGIGEPVKEWEKPVQGEDGGRFIVTDDEFDGETLSLLWQWQANPDDSWYECRKEDSCLRLFMVKNRVREQPLFWYQPNLLTQIPQSTAFTAEIKLKLHGEQDGDMAGVGMLGHKYAFACVKQEGSSRKLVLVKGTVTTKDYAGEAEEEIQEVNSLPQDGWVWIRMLAASDSAAFSYSTDGTVFTKAGDSLGIDRATWTGVKAAVAVRNGDNRESKGYCDVDYIRFTAGAEEQE